MAKAIPIIGWFGRHNSGDEAFRDVHKLLLPNKSLAWSQPGRGENVYDPPVEIRDDIALVSAGDIVSDFYFDTIPPKSRIVVFGAGLAWQDEAQLLARYKDRLEAVWVRNQADVAPLVELGIKARYTPDIVFNLAPLVKPAPRSPGKKKKAYVLISDNKRGAALRGNDLGLFFRIQTAFSEIARAVNYLSKWYEITFLPFSFDRNDFDLAAIYDVLPRLKNPDDAEIISSELAPLEAINLLATADLVITTKFHGVVYSLLTNVPFLAISDTRKVEDLCKVHGFSDLWQPMVGFDADKFKTALLTAESANNRNHISQVRDTLIEQAQQEAVKFQQVLKNW